MNRGGVETIQEAMGSLREIARVVDLGKVGTEVVIPLNEAALIFRLSIDTLQGMGERDHQLGISVRGSQVIVKLHPGEKERRANYTFLYGLIQTAGEEQADLFLGTQEINPSLLSGIPELEEIINLLEKGKSALPDEDMGILHIYLCSLWLSINDKTGLFDPGKVFSSLGRG